MVYNARNYFFGYHQSSDILKHNISETGSVFVNGWEAPALLGPLEGTNLSHYPSH
jgi:hypothetical protein